MSNQSLIPSFKSQELKSLDNVAETLLGDIKVQLEKIKTLANPMSIDVEYLPQLAYAFKADFWSPILDEQNKRELIQNSIILHKHKGTIFALKKVFEALNISAEVLEWNSYGGEPYHFKIDLSLEDKEVTPAVQDELLKFIEIYKNARSHLEELVLSYSTQTSCGFASGAIGETSINAIPLEGYEESMLGNIYISAGVIGEASATAVMEV